MCMSTRHLLMMYLGCKYKGERENNFGVTQAYLLNSVERKPEMRVYVQ